MALKDRCPALAPTREIHPRTRESVAGNLEVEGVLFRVGIGVTAAPAQVFLEDAGFDWKILGPDVSDEAYVAWQCDQDAYACSGQKCSAQSMLFMHSNWAKAGECRRTPPPSPVPGHGSAGRTEAPLVPRVQDLRGCSPQAPPSLLIDGRVVPRA